MPDSWIGSVDVNSWVQNLMDREVKQISAISAKQVAQLAKTQKSMQTKVNQYAQLSSLLTTLQTNIQNLSTAFNPTYTISSSNSTVASATPITGSSTSASAGSHVLAVNQLANAESVASQVFTSSSPEASETMTLTVGTSSFNVPVKTTDSLQTIASNINIGATANSVGVTAYVINPAPNQYQLVVASTQTGTANEVSISETGAGPFLKVSTGAGANAGTVLTAASDAIFSFDNVNYTQSSNSNLAIGGLNINLLSAGTLTTPVTTTFIVSATDPVTNVSTAAQSVVDAYNAVDLFIEQTQIQNPPPDSTLTLVLSSLQAAIAGKLGGSSQYQSLASVGIVANPKPSSVTVQLANEVEIAFTPSGQLQINSDSTNGAPTLQNALTTNFSAVQALLTSSKGIFSQISTELTTSSGSIWKTINDPNTGGTALANKQIADLKNQIHDEKDNLENQKKALVLKYAKLDMLLAQLQGKAQYMSSQIAIMGNNNH